MEEEKDKRDCNCQMNEFNCNYDVSGINAAYGYNTMQALQDDLIDNNNYMNDEDNLRKKLLKEIKCLNFAIVELAEYLDTHPDDRKAICLHREYTNRLKKVKEKYERVFGPLSIYCPCNKWRWLEMPWPWERSDFNVDL